MIDNSRLPRQHSLPPINYHTRGQLGATEMIIAHRKSVKSCFKRYSKGLQHRALQSGEVFRPKIYFKSSECDRYLLTKRK